MRLAKTFAITSLVLAGLAPASAALAQDGWYEPAYQGADYARPIPIDRALAERCGFYAGAVRPHEMGPYRAAYRRDDGLGGALIGGAVGGLVGNRIAGRGDRTIGTVAGAAVGAIAGSAIDRAEDRGRTPYDAEPGAAYYGNECDAAFPPGYRLVSVPGEPDCRDEVVTREEWVPETVTVPGTPRRAAPLRDKRTKLRRVK
jgi:hypothetical protein